MRLDKKGVEAALHTIVVCCTIHMSNVEKKILFGTHKQGWMKKVITRSKRDEVTSHVQGRSNRESYLRRMYVCTKLQTF